MKTYFASCLLLLILCFPLDSYSQLNEDLEIETVFTLEDSDLYIESIVPHDLNSNGYEDLLITVLKRSELWASLYVLPGAEAGFNQDDAILLIEGDHISNLQVGDWNGNHQMDLIVEKQTTQGGSYTEVYLMNGMEIDDTLRFSVRNEGYSFTNPVAIIAAEDMNLNGRVDLVYGSYNELIVAWNQNESVSFEAITLNARNSYRAEVLDINQDGFMDIIVDEKTENAPVVFINQQDQTFEIKSVGLPPTGPEPGVGIYYQYKPILFNDDIYPDLLVNREVKIRTDTLGYPVIRPRSEVYLFDSESDRYEKSSFNIDSLYSYSFFYPVHANNSGYLDFIQKIDNKIIVLENEDNSNYSLNEYTVSSDVSFWDLTNVDADQDGDQDILYSEFHESTVYQITNNDTAETNFPDSPEFTTAEANGNTLNLSWQLVFQENNSAQVEYGIKIDSPQRNLRFGNVNLANGNRQTSKRLAGFQNNALKIPNLPNGTYNVEITTYNQLGGFSGFSNRETITINQTSFEKEPERVDQFALFQNYPNPFNPVTQITYQLPETSEVTLKVFDVTGRMVTTLVNEIQSPGTHTVPFNAGHLSSGLYLYRLEAEDQVFTRKLMLVK